MSSLQEIYRLVVEVVVTWGMFCFLIGMMAGGGKGMKLFLIPLKKVGGLFSDLMLWLVEKVFHWFDTGLRAFGRWLVRLFRRSRSTP